MTRKDYIAIANAIRSEMTEWEQGRRAPGPDPRLVLVGVAARIATVMALDNPSFEVARFLDACGV